MAFEYLLMLFLLLILLRHVLRKPLKNLPPGPRPLPLLGNLLQLGDLPHRSFAELARQHGPLMSLRLGVVPYLFVSSPAAAAQVLRKHDQVLSYRAPPDALRALDHYKLSMVHTPPGPAWRALRKICNSHIFNSQSLDQSQDLRQRKVRELVSVLKESARKREPVDVWRAAFTVTINLLSNTIFSEDMTRYEEDSSGDFKHLVRQCMIEVASPNISDYFPLLRWLDLQGRRRRATRDLQKLKDIFFAKMDDRQSSRKSRDISEPEDFMDVVLDAMSAKELDRPTVEALLLDLFAAGSDTSSSTVEWAMAELLRNPKAMERAREEVAAAMDGSGEDAVGESDIARMPYLQAVVKETLRLHPPAPLLIPRRASATVDLAADDESKSSYTIPAGTRIMVNAWAIGRDPTTWGSDADLFRPERFAAGERGHVEYKGQHMEFIPFGAGRRVCPGLPLASRMMHLLIANFIWFFEWRLPEGTLPADICMEEEFGLTLSKAEPLLAVPVLAK
ncbi:geraniol 8-hydroxylase-like [Wolffia australiana]